jgi:hypothetical protein
VVTQEIGQFNVPAKGISNKTADLGEAKQAEILSVFVPYYLSVILNGFIALSSTEYVYIVSAVMVTSCLITELWN